MLFQIYQKAPMEWFKDDSEDPRSRVALAAAEMVAPNDSCFPEMSFKQRLIGFGVTVVLGIVLSILVCLT